MNLTLALAIFFICWWIAFFIVLPIGVRTQGDEGRIEPGTPSSAPASPRLLRMLIVATCLGAVLFAAVFSIIVFELFGLDDIPFLPRFETP